MACNSASPHSLADLDFWPARSAMAGERTTRNTDAAGLSGGYTVQLTQPSSQERPRLTTGAFSVGVAHSRRAAVEHADEVEQDQDQHADHDDDRARDLPERLEDRIVSMM